MDRGGPGGRTGARPTRFPHPDADRPALHRLAPDGAPAPPRRARSAASAASGPLRLRPRPGGAPATRHCPRRSRRRAEGVVRGTSLRARRAHPLRAKVVPAAGARLRGRRTAVSPRSRPPHPGRCRPASSRGPLARLAPDPPAAPDRSTFGPALAALCIVDSTLGRRSAPSVSTGASGHGEQPLVPRAALPHATCKPDPKRTTPASRRARSRPRSALEDRPNARLQGRSALLFLCCS